MKSSFQEHLLTCADCRAAQRSLEGLDEALREAAPAELLGIGADEFDELGIAGVGSATASADDFVTENDVRPDAEEPGWICVLEADDRKDPGKV